VGLAFRAGRVCSQGKGRIARHAAWDTRGCVGTRHRRLVRLRGSRLLDAMRRTGHDYLDPPAHKTKRPTFHNRTHGALGRCQTYSWPSSRKRALEAAPLSRSSATWSIGTTGVKTTAELLEQQDTSASATGTTRAPPAVRRPISGSITCSEQVCRKLDAGLRQLANEWARALITRPR
jgi:hypothetical protein